MPTYTVAIHPVVEWKFIHSVLSVEIADALKVLGLSRKLVSGHTPSSYKPYSLKSQGSFSISTSVEGDIDWLRHL